MIDIHSHVLYGVDDGAQSLDETRALLRQAYDQGIKTLIATPHQRKGRFEASRSTIDKHFQDLQTIAQEIAPDLTVHLGTEVFYYIFFLINNLHKKYKNLSLLNLFLLH